MAGSSATCTIIRKYFLFNVQKRSRPMMYSMWLLALTLDACHHTIKCLPSMRQRHRRMHVDSVLLGVDQNAIVQHTNTGSLAPAGPPYSRGTLCGTNAGDAPCNNVCAFICLCSLHRYADRALVLQIYSYNSFVRPYMRPHHASKQR